MHSQTFLPVCGWQFFRQSHTSILRVKCRWLTIYALRKKENHYKTSWHGLIILRDGSWRTATRCEAQEFGNFFALTELLCLKVSRVSMIFWRLNGKCAFVWSMAFKALARKVANPFEVARDIVLNTFTICDFYSRTCFLVKFTYRRSKIKVKGAHFTVDTISM